MIHRLFTALLILYSAWSFVVLNRIDDAIDKNRASIGLLARADMLIVKGIQGIRGE